MELTFRLLAESALVGIDQRPRGAPLVPVRAFLAVVLQAAVTLYIVENQADAAAQLT